MELIIVITILAILSTIAFVSFKNYSGNARDGNRVSTLKSIEKGLELYFVKTWEFPSPEGNILTWSMSWTHIMYSGEIWESISSAIKLNKLALDPTLGKNYKYWITANKQEYNLWWIGESDSISQRIISTTYADNYFWQVVGNYRGYIKYSTGSLHYLTNVPSLIFTYSGSVTDVYNEKDKVHFVIKKWENIPYEVSGKVNSENPDDVIQRKTGKTNARFENIDITSVINVTSDEEKKQKIEELLWDDEGTKKTILDSFWIDNEDTFETIVNWKGPQWWSNNSNPSWPQTPSIQSCTHLWQEIVHNGTMNVYSENTIAYNASYDCEERRGEVSCNNGILSWDTTFLYKAGECVKWTPTHCSAQTWFNKDWKNFNIPELSHSVSAEPKPYVDILENNGTFRYELSATCNDGVLDTVISPAIVQNCNPNYNIVNGACELKTYTVTFQTNGGSTIISQIININSKVSKPTDPTRLDYTFEWWYKDTQFTTLWNFTTDIVTTNITLYAKWEVNCNLNTTPSIYFTYQDIPGWIEITQWSMNLLRNANIKQISIPCEINGKKVISIGSDTFRQYSEKWLTQIVLPDTIVKIWDYAFYYNAIVNVNIPASVTNIWTWAFSANNLTSVTLWNSVISIWDYAFYYNAIVNVNIPTSVTSIWTWAFSQNNLTSVTLWNSVISIWDYAFRINQLASVTIPNSVTSIWREAFSGNNLTSVTIWNNVTSIWDNAFTWNNLTSITIPNSITSIWRDAFTYNKITSVTIWNSVTSIWINAFAVNNLTSVTIPNSVISIWNNAFGNNWLSKNSYDIERSWTHWWTSWNGWTWKIVWASTTWTKQP